MTWWWVLIIIIIIGQYNTRGVFRLVHGLSSVCLCPAYLRELEEDEE